MTERVCPRCGKAMEQEAARICADCVEGTNYLTRLFSSHLEGEDQEADKAEEEAEHARGAGAQAARGSSGEVPE